MDRTNSIWDQSLAPHTNQSDIPVHWRDTDCGLKIVDRAVDHPRSDETRANTIDCISSELMTMRSLFNPSHL